MTRFRETSADDERLYTHLKQRLQSVGEDQGFENGPAWRILDHLFDRDDLNCAEIGRLLVIALWDEARLGAGYVKPDWQKLQLVVEARYRRRPAPPITEEDTADDSFED